MPFLCCRLGGPSGLATLQLLAVCRESMEHAVADVGGERGTPRGDEPEVQWRYAVEEAFARADGDRHDVGADLVDEVGGEILVDCGGSAGDGDVALFRGLAGLIEGRPDPVGHEGERRAAR